MTNDDVIEAFIAGEHGHANSLSIRYAPHGLALYSYEEPICHRQLVGSRLVVFRQTLHKFSMTTTQHQSGVSGALALAQANGAIHRHMRRIGGEWVARESRPIDFAIELRMIERDQLRVMCDLPDREPDVHYVGSPSNGGRRLIHRDGRELTRSGW
jgi:hypothetical protein